MNKSRLIYFRHVLYFSLILASTFSASKELLMLSDDAPPHMIAASNSGIDIDITREVLQGLGYNVNYAVAPLARSMREVQQKKADLFLPTFFQEDTDTLFVSNAIIRYRPTVFSLTEHGYQLANLSDLKGKRIATFQGATGYFGDEFKKIAQQSNYRELHDMSILPQLLLKKRCDIVVLDYYIFYYFLRQYQSENPEEKSLSTRVNAFDLIPSVKAYVGFNNEKLRDNFNQQLTSYIEQGKDQLIVEKYIGKRQNLATFSPIQ